MRITQIDIAQPLLVRLTGIVIDRPVLEKEVRQLAADPRLDLQARSKEQLAQALIVFAQKTKAVDEQLGRLVLKATALERERLTKLSGDWQDALLPVFAQKRTGAKFLMAMFLSPPPWPERGQIYIKHFEQHAEVLKKAEAIGVRETIEKLEQEFTALHKRSNVLEQKVMTLERERASVVAQLGQREADLKHVGQKAQLLERELSQARKAPSAPSGDGDALRKKLRRLEKQAAFARDRERDRELLTLLEHERDALLRELHVLRLQLQVSAAMRGSVVSVTAEPAPKPVKTTLADAKPSVRAALYVDGANVAGAARLLHQRKVDFGKLRDLLLAREAASMRAYVIDNGAVGFDAFMQALKAQGYRVHRKKTKTLPDGSVKADLDVQIAVDVMADQPGPTRVILVTGDSDFVPLVLALKQRQVRVEAAMFRARAAKELIEAVDAFWALDEAVLVS